MSYVPTFWCGPSTPHVGSAPARAVAVVSPLRKPTNTGGKGGASPYPAGIGPGGPVDVAGDHLEVRRENVERPVKLGKCVVRPDVAAAHDRVGAQLIVRDLDAAGREGREGRGGVAVDQPVQAEREDGRVGIPPPLGLV